MIATFGFIWDAVSGIALGAMAVVFGMVAFIVYRLLRETRATGTTRHKMPTHILLVGVGTVVWGVGQFDTVLDHLGDGLPPEWSAAPTALLGSLLLLVGLWKMIEVQRLRYRTLGGQTRAEEVAVAFDEDAEPPTLPLKNAERLTRLSVEGRVLFGVAMIGLVFGFSQTATNSYDNCISNNEQDAILESLVKARLATDPSALADDPEGARRVKDAFEKALVPLQDPQDCPAKGL